MVIYAQLEESDINKPPISPLFRNRKGVLAKLSGHFFVLWQKKKAPKDFLLFLITRHWFWQHLLWLSYIKGMGEMKKNNFNLRLA
jgi:hypothetical protein